MDILKKSKPIIGLLLVMLLVLLFNNDWLKEELTPADSTTIGTASTQTDARTSLNRFTAEERGAIEATLALIDSGGPFPYPKDGAVFSNREGRLPKMPSGYYLEYTVATPGSPDRGARRIVAGQDGDTYYTNDHYDSFARIR